MARKVVIVTQTECTLELKFALATRSPERTLKGPHEMNGELSGATHQSSSCMGRKLFL